MLDLLDYYLEFLCALPLRDRSVFERSGGSKNLGFRARLPGFQSCCLFLDGSKPEDIHRHCASVTSSVKLGKSLNTFKQLV